MEDQDTAPIKTIQQLIDDGDMAGVFSTDNLVNPQERLRFPICVEFIQQLEDNSLQCGSLGPRDMTEAWQIIRDIEECNPIPSKEGSFDTSTIIVYQLLLNLDGRDPVILTQSFSDENKESDENTASVDTAIT